MSRHTALLICDDIPMRGRSGHQSYLRDIVDYFVQRDYELFILSLTDRVGSPIQRQSMVGFGADVTFKNPNLFHFKNYLIAKSIRSWVRPTFLYFKHKYISWMYFLFGISDNTKSNTAYIGRFIKPHEECLINEYICNIHPDFIIVDTIFRSARKARFIGKKGTILIAHDVFYLKCISLSKVYKKVIPFVTKEMEVDIVGQFRYIIAITPDDREELSRLSPNSHVVTISPPMEYRGGGRRVSEARCVFIGSGATHNIDGINWFLLNIWPQILGSCPDAKLDIVGTVCRNIPDVVGVNRLHIVDDVGDILLRATCAINPLRAGSGMKIKMIDYISYGVPVVTTEVGAQGLIRDGNEPFIVCNDASEFAAEIVDLLRNASRIESLSFQCRSYASRFSRETNVIELDKIFM